MDNNTAERAIRPFTLGRKNWVNVDSIRGADASAIMYSLVETAKANELRVYEYLEYVLTELAASTLPCALRKIIITLFRTSSSLLSRSSDHSAVLSYPHPLRHSFS